MVIVSQEKDAILNFENIIAIRMSIDIETNKRNIIAIDTLDNERYYIAKYATEERAKEVLKEIMEIYKVSIPTACYEMPEDKEDDDYLSF